MKITFVGDNFGKKLVMERVINEFLDKIEMPVIVENHHGHRNDPPDDDGNLHIFCWSKASTGGRFSPKCFRRKIFGIDPCEDAYEGLEPSQGDDIRHIVSPEGEIIAEVSEKRPNNLHILFNLPHQCSEGAGRHLRGILEIFCSQFFCSKKAFANALTMPHKTIDRFHEKIAKLSRERNDKVRSASFMQLYLPALHDLMVTNSDKYLADYDVLSKDNKVIIREDEIHVVFGRNRLIFDRCGGYHLISGGYEMPFHEICKGSAKAGLAQLIGKCDFPMATKMIKRWLTAYRKKGTPMKRDTRAVKIQVNEDTRKARRLLETYADKYSVRIFLHATHGERHPVMGGDKFIHIFPFSTGIVSHVETHNIYELFHLKPSCHDSVIAAEEDIVGAGGIPLKDDSGQLFGELHGWESLNNLYIHNDITHEWSGNTEEIFAKMLDAYFAIASDSDNVKAILKSKRAMERKLARESRARYAELCTKGISIEVDRLKSELAQSEKRVKELSEEIAGVCREQGGLRERIAVLGNNSSKAAHFFEKEYGKLKAFKAVEKVLVKDGKVEIYTRELILEGHLIGRSFKINLDVQNGTFECFNLDKVIDGYHHPHISGSEICFGKAHEDIADLISRYQIFMAFHRIWSRLNMYSEDDSYTEITKWPKASKETK